MDWFRFKHTIGLLLCRTGQKRAEYLKEHNVLFHVGEGCMTMLRIVPLYPKLISIGDNVWIASNVNFVTHDVIHRMLNNRNKTNEFQEYMGPIQIGDNVFVGAGSRILCNVAIGSNTVIAAGSLVNRSIPGNGVYGGVPAKYICSLEDLIEKRRNRRHIKITKNKNGELSEKTVEECWTCFKIEKMEKATYEQ